MYSSFEMQYLMANFFMPYLYKRVRSDLRTIVKAYQARNSDTACLLDVGARKSHYTIGIPAYVTLLDVPQQNDIQRKLNLGLTDGKINQVMERRSNIKEIILQDFLCNTLPASSFDVVSAIEVIEHIQQDRQFVGEVFRVLKPGGVFYLTTPNGAAVRNTNPDHVRHYAKPELLNLLHTLFDDINVQHVVKISSFYRWGLQSWSLKYPGITAKSMIGNLINGFQIIKFPNEAAHLVACAVKRI